MKENIFCKKLVFVEQERTKTIYGLIESEDSNFIHFKTANKKYLINKSSILVLCDTDRIFEGDLQ